MIVALITCLILLVIVFFLLIHRERRRFALYWTDFGYRKAKYFHEERLKSREDILTLVEHYRAISDVNWPHLWWVSLGAEAYCDEGGAL